MTTAVATDTKCIARFWKRADGASCYLYKRIDGWWLTIERDGESMRELHLERPNDAFRMADQWRAE